MTNFLKIFTLTFSLLLLVSCGKEENLGASMEQQKLDETSAEFKKKPAPQKEEIFCGNGPSKFRLPLSQTEINTQANSFSPLPPIDVEILYHIVRTDDGMDGIPISELTTITNNINANFDMVLYGILNFVMAPDRLNFINSGYDYIDDSDYHLAEDSDFAALTSINNDPDKINIYIVKELTDSDGDQIGGLGSTPGNRVISNRYNGTYLGSSPAHEVGHNLGMQHTHEFSAGLCLVDDNYSSTTGDGIYDTPLDYSLSGQINSACAYTGSQMTACGENLGPGISDPHYVMEKNTMSYSRHACRVGFSGIQHMQMNAQALDSGLGTEGAIDVQ